MIITYTLHHIRYSSLFGSRVAAEDGDNWLWEKETVNEHTLYNQSTDIVVSYIDNLEGHYNYSQNQMGQAHILFMWRTKPFTRQQALAVMLAYTADIHQTIRVLQSNKDEHKGSGSNEQRGQQESSMDLFRVE